MVGLLAARPQRGKSGLRNLEAVGRDFEALFTKHCQDVGHGRITGEKELQSFLIADAFRNGRSMRALNEASRDTNDPVELIFITDELPLPLESGKIVCDILALRRDHERSTPVLIELKDSRTLGRLVAQVDRYGALLDQHAQSFAKLFEAVLGEPIQFDGSAERWIVWPAPRSGAEPREDELLERGIRCVGYRKVEGAYEFAAGRSPRPPCLCCDSWKHAVPIVFGLPGEELEERALRGEVVLGGCCVTDDDPRWFCKRCEEELK